MRKTKKSGDMNEEHYWASESLNIKALPRKAIRISIPCKCLICNFDNFDLNNDFRALNTKNYYKYIEKRENREAVEQVITKENKGNCYSEHRTLIICSKCRFIFNSKKHEKKMIC